MIRYALFTIFIRIMKRPLREVCAGFVPFMVSFCQCEYVSGCNRVLYGSDFLNFFWKVLSRQLIKVNIRQILPSARRSSCLWSFEFISAEHSLVLKYTSQEHWTGMLKLWIEFLQDERESNLFYVQPIWQSLSLLWNMEPASVAFAGSGAEIALLLLISS